MSENTPRYTNAADLYRALLLAAQVAPVTGRRELMAHLKDQGGAVYRRAYEIAKQRAFIAGAPWDMLDCTARNAAEAAVAEYINAFDPGLNTAPQHITFELATGRLKLLYTRPRLLEAAAIVAKNWKLYGGGEKPAELQPKPKASKKWNPAAVRLVAELLEDCQYLEALELAEKVGGVVYPMKGGGGVLTWAPETDGMADGFVSVRHERGYWVLHLETGVIHSGAATPHKTRKSAVDAFQYELTIGGACSPAECAQRLQEMLSGVATLPEADTEAARAEWLKKYAPAAVVPDVTPAPAPAAEEAQELPEDAPEWMRVLFAGAAPAPVAEEAAPVAPAAAVVVPVVAAAPVEAVVVPVVAPTEAPEVAPASQEPAPVPSAANEVPQVLAPTEAPTAAPTEAPTAAPVVAEVVADAAPASQEPAPVPSAADEVPPVQKLKHGKNWAGQDLTGWAYSEKLDGCRAYWDGVQFWGKDGQPLHLPEIAANMPAGVVLDGEIWAGRGNFEAARLYVQYGTPSELVRFVAFDAPTAKGTWAQRLQTVQGVECVTVHAITSMTEMAQEVADLLDAGAEGVMCHAPQVNAYRGGRDATLIKIKAHTFCHFEAFFDHAVEAPTAAPVVAEVVADAAPASQEPAPVPSAADKVPQDLAPVVAGFVADIPAGLAVQAYTGTSFSPERRGASIRKEYADDLAQVLDVLQEHARKGGTLDKLADVFQAYRTRQGRALRAYLASSSHCFSAMIAGPARFPVARMQKREGIAHKRLNEYLDGGKVALQRAIRELRPDLRPIMASDADAIDRLTAKLAQAERDHAMMKAGNVAIRKHAKAGQAHQVAALLELGFTEHAAMEATKPDYMGRLGFARFELTNSNANIKRIKERIEQIERNQAAQVVQTEGADGVTLEDDAPANRVRLYFPGKPSDDVRADLKAHGFRWAPSVGAWQAYRNWRALTAAQRLAGVNLAEAQAPTTAPELAEVAAEVAPAAQELAPVLVVADEVPQDLAPTEAPTAAPTEAPTAAPELAEVVAEVAPAAQEPAPVPAVTDEGPQDLTPVVPVLHQKARAKSGAWTAQLWQAGGLCWLAFLVLGAAAPVFSSYATRREMLTALQRLGAGLLAQGGALGLVEHTTARGKVLRGVVRADLTKAQAQALDAYTFRKDGGWFIRERHLTEAAPVVAQAVQVAPAAQEVAPVPTVADKVAQVLADAQQATAADERAALLAQFAHLEQGGGPAVASRNIKRQLKRAWPGVVFSVRKSSTGAVNVQWADGPTEGQVNALLRRFKLGSFDGMTDCYEYRADAFSDLFGGCHYLFTRRTVGAELVQRAIDALFSGCADVPSAEDYQASRGKFDWRTNEGRSWAHWVRDALAKLDATAERADVAELA